MYLKGDCLLILERNEATLPATSEVVLTELHICGQVSGQGVQIDKKRLFGHLFLVAY